MVLTYLFPNVSVLAQDELNVINSSNDAYMRQWTGPPLIQKMAYRLHCNSYHNTATLIDENYLRTAVYKMSAICLGLNLLSLWLSLFMQVFLHTGS